LQNPSRRFKSFAAILKAPGLFSEFLALALRRRPMATMIPCVETREVLRCEYCRLTQYRTSNSLCRRCHKPLDLEEPEQFAPPPIPGPVAFDGQEAGSQVAARVLEIRRARHLSQRQLAARMEVPRTYISKIENGKAIPTLGSLERLACALDVEVGQLVRDARSRREELVAAVFADPLLAEIAGCLPHLNSLQRSLVLSAARDAAMGRRRSA
jgi:transcriptional regulator with XRE-family HTH domain